LLDRGIAAISEPTLVRSGSDHHTYIELIRASERVGFGAVMMSVAAIHEMVVAGHPARQVGERVKLGTTISARPGMK
jgi:hypothetical protein